eukprot:1033441-Pleurochrysis_carterae.AAC.2
MTVAHVLDIAAVAKTDPCEAVDDQTQAAVEQGLARFPREAIFSPWSRAYPRVPTRRYVWP